MRDKFVTSDFCLDLSEIELTYIDKNPRFSDSFFSQYTFPFEFYIDSSLRREIGAVDHLQAINVQRKFEGDLVFEGRTRKGVLEITEVKGNKLKCQISCGFENLPNFNTPLRSLPFPFVSTNGSSIYAFAHSIVQKQYPETNFNFPCVIYKENSKDEPEWKLFNQFLNDTNENGYFIDNNEDRSDWNDNGNVNQRDKYYKNRNIIHPMPYVLHILKVGFGDAGYELKGDILTDEVLLQKVVYAPKDSYFGDKQGFPRMNFWMKEDDIVSSSFLGANQYGQYFKIRTIKEIKSGYGLFYINGQYSLEDYTYSGNFFIKITIGSTILFFDQTPTDHNQTEEFSISYFNYNPGAIIKVEMVSATRGYPDFLWPPSFSAEIKYPDNETSTGEYFKRLHNANHVDIKNYVPDMNFGDFVKIIKNLRGYDIDISGNKIYMNRLSNIIEEGELKDFSEWLVDEPIKKFNDKRSFNIVFPDIGFDTKNMLVKDNGVWRAGVPDKTAIEVKINAYGLLPEMYKEKTTAIPKIEDKNVLGLIHYEGVNAHQKNWSGFPDGVYPYFEDVMSEIGPWYKKRISNSSFQWSFLVNKNKFRHINIKDEIYVYGQRAWIKEMSKTSIDKKTYKIEIVVEVIG